MNGTCAMIANTAPLTRLRLSALSLAKPLLPSPSGRGRGPARKCWEGEGRSLHHPRSRSMWSKVE